MFAELVVPQQAVIAYKGWLEYFCVDLATVETYGQAMQLWRLGKTTELSGMLLGLLTEEAGRKTAQRKGCQALLKLADQAGVVLPKALMERATLCVRMDL